MRGTFAVRSAPGIAAQSPPPSQGIVVGASLRSVMAGAGILVSLANVARAQSAAPVRYDLTLPGGDDGTVSVVITLPSPVTQAVDFAMPRSIPMGYGTQPYDRFVTDLSAHDARGTALAITDIDGPRWRIAASMDHPLRTIRYRVDVRRMEAAILNAGDASRIRPGYVGLLGYSVFGFLDAFIDTPIALEVRAPERWPIFTTLGPAPARGTSSATARNFYALADAQLFAGPDLVLRQITGGVPFTLALYAERPGPDADSLATLASQALRETIAYFGSSTLAHYTSSFEVLQPLSNQHEYRFSMEHLESATYRFAVGQLDLSAAARDRVYYNLLHHTVHSWLPKQCAPAGYYPFTWDHAAPIDGIWFSEGWAQYIAADIFGGSGSDARRRRQERVALRFDAAAADSLPPMRGRSTTALSRTASHQYSDDFRISAAVFSRGAKMASAIDDRIRTRTGERQSIRDVARALLSWCATSTTPVSDTVIATIVRQTTGVDVRDLIDRWLAPQGVPAFDRPRP